MIARSPPVPPVEMLSTQQTQQASGVQQITNAHAAHLPNFIPNDLIQQTHATSSITLQTPKNLASSNAVLAPSRVPVRTAPATKQLSPPRKLQILSEQRPLVSFVSRSAPTCDRSDSTTSRSKSSSTQEVTAAPALQTAHLPLQVVTQRQAIAPALPSAPVTGPTRQQPTHSVQFVRNSMQQHLQEASVGSASAEDSHLSSTAHIDMMTPVPAAITQESRSSSLASRPVALSSSSPVSKPYVISPIATTPPSRPEQQVTAQGASSASTSSVTAASTLSSPSPKTIAPLDAARHCALMEHSQNRINICSHIHF